MKNALMVITGVALAVGSTSSVANAQTLPVVRISAPARGDGSIAGKMTALANAMSIDVAPGALTLHRATLPVLGQVSHARYEAALDNAPGVYTRYETQDDSFEVYSTNALGEPAPAATDIAKDAAIQIFDDTLESLYSSGVLNRSNVSRKDLVVREIHCSEGDQSGLRRDWIDEYLLFAPATIEGVHIGSMEREYGVTVNVHKSGQVRRIEISGAAIAASEPGTIGTVRQVQRAQRTTDLDALAKGALGSESLISRIGLRYVADELASGVLVPRDLVKVYPARPGDVAVDGQPLYGKAYMVSLAIDDASDRIDVFPPIGDPGPRPWDTSTK